MKWRWKPDGCDLPIFNPYQFLEIVRDKSLAFVGDSVGRNQMQSLICMLSRVSSSLSFVLFEFNLFIQVFLVINSFFLMVYKDSNV